VTNKGRLSITSPINGFETFSDDEYLASESNFDSDYDTEVESINGEDSASLESKVEPYNSEHYMKW